MRALYLMSPPSPLGEARDWGPRGFLILGESADQNAGVIERWNRESREVLDQARVGLSYVHSPALYAVFSLCIFRASLREPVFFVCRLSAV